MKKKISFFVLSVFFFLIFCFSFCSILFQFTDLLQIFLFLIFRHFAPFWILLIFFMLLALSSCAFEQPSVLRSLWSLLSLSLKNCQ